MQRDWINSKNYSFSRRLHFGIVFVVWKEISTQRWACHFDKIQWNQNKNDCGIGIDTERLLGDANKCWFFDFATRHQSIWIQKKLSLQRQQVSNMEFKSNFMARRLDSIPNRKWLLDFEKNLHESVEWEKKGDFEARKGYQIDYSKSKMIKI